jgi:outer membrane protein insertion porin family
MGGMNSLRGFEWRDIHALDEDGNEIGGDKFVQFNVEYRIPVYKKLGLFGVIFFDTGDVYNNDESVDLGSLKQSAGFGFRWYSPMGPIRIEYGHILDAGDLDEDGGRWDFSMGGAF